MQKIYLQISTERELLNLKREGVALKGKKINYLFNLAPII